MNLIYLLYQVHGIHQPACPGIREPRTANRKPQADSVSITARPLVLSPKP